MTSNTNIQYAVCHLQRGSGNDSGMSAHIERRTADGKTYVPDNADKSRTHLNREFIRFPDGVVNRTAAIQYRIDHAGLHRKVGSNQTKAVRIILTGTHEQMARLEREGRLEAWTAANLRWLKDTFGEENLVSCVLHMDEKTPHLHATIVPIVTYARERRKREGERKNSTKSGPRLSADDVMKRWRLREYQDSYAKAMRPFGLERGVVGSTARHKANSTYYKEAIVKYETDIAWLQEEVEKAKEGRSTILALFGKGELAKAKRELSVKDAEIARLKEEIAKMQSAKVQVQQRHRSELSSLKDGYKAEIAEAIKRAETAETKASRQSSTIERLQRRIDELDRKANPGRYTLSSGAELIHFFIPNRNNPSLHIWTKVDGEEYDISKPVDYFSAIWSAYDKGEATIHELVNEVFEPQEQVNEAQARLLGAAFTLTSGGPAQPHVGTGSGGTQSDLPWRDKENNRTYPSKRRK